MKTCKKCAKQFKMYVEINGKIRNLHQRSYCLECSPFNKRNHRKLEKILINSKGEEFCICRYCHREYPYHDKGWGSLSQCSSCTGNRLRISKKERAVKYKGGKCSRCGYNKCLSALEFHHRDPSKKSFNIGETRCTIWAIVKPELDKCDLVCANCHREIESELASL